MSRGIRTVAVGGVVAAVFVFVGIALEGTTTERASIDAVDDAASTTPVAAGRALVRGALEPGDYYLDVGLDVRTGDTSVVQGRPHRVTFRVPAGWTGTDDGAVTKVGASPATQTAMHVSQIQHVLFDPCHWRDAEERGDMADGGLMHSPDGVATALTSWWNGDGTYQPSPTAPTATFAGHPRLAGREAAYVEVTAPTLDFAACDDGLYRPWNEVTGGWRTLSAPGEHLRLWVVPLTGPASANILVVEGAAGPEASAGDRAELDAMVQSIQIDGRAS